MSSRAPSPGIERFPQGWAVRRSDGTIKTIIGLASGDGGADDVAKARAIEIAKVVALHPNDHGQVNRHFDEPPSMVVAIRRRHRGRAAKPENQYSIHVSLQLVLFSHSEDSGSRYHRWYKVSLGEMGSLTDKGIRDAWERVYGAWAWATHMRRDNRVVDLLKLAVPADTSTFLNLIRNVPKHPSKFKLWESHGFDPLTNTDSKARIIEVKKLAGSA